MKSRFLITALLAGMAFLFAVQPAQAEPENPIVRGSLHVEVIGGGKVTGTGIDCGADCAHDAAWRDNELPPTNRLTATPNPGWGFQSWSGCSVRPSNQCDASYGTELTTEVTARFMDVQAPTVFLQQPANGAVVGNTVHGAVQVTDNDRVARVDYLIDGAVVGTSNTGSFEATIDVSGVTEGEHQFQARAYDPTGNNGITAARTFTVDHTPPVIELNSPLTATSSARPEFSFNSSSTDLGQVSCVIQKKGDERNYSTCAPGTWFAGDAPEEGEWQFAVWATDAVGNLTQVIHDFVVDRTAPVAGFTSGPADGSVVEVGNVKYTWTATDLLPVTQRCVWDGGEAAACDGSSARGLTAGAHSFKVTLTDQAGNETVLSRTVNVKKDGDTPPPDPTADRKPPVVKIVAPRQKLGELGKRLRLNVRCNEACSGKVVVKGKAGKAVVKYTGRVVLAKAGVAKLKLRTNAKLRKALKRFAPSQAGRRPLRLAANATLRDKAGNTGKASLRFKVRK